MRVDQIQAHIFRALFVHTVGTVNREKIKKKNKTKSYIYLRKPKLYNDVNRPKTVYHLGYFEWVSKNDHDLILLCTDIHLLQKKKKKIFIQQTTPWNDDMNLYTTHNHKISHRVYDSVDSSEMNDPWIRWICLEFGEEDWNWCETWAYVKMCWLMNTHSHSHLLWAVRFLLLLLLLLLLLFLDINSTIAALLAVQCSFFALLYRYTKHTISISTLCICYMNCNMNSDSQC